MKTNLQLAIRGIVIAGMLALANGQNLISLAPSGSGTNGTLQWPVTTNAYFLETATNLVASWKSASIKVAVDGGLTKTTVPFSAAAGFYRLVDRDALRPCRPDILSGPITNLVVVPRATNVTLRVEAAGNPTPSYQWLKGTGDGGFISIRGATNHMLLLSEVGPFDDGSQYQCVVGNTCGTVFSPVATLRVPASGPIVARGYNRDVIVENTAVGPDTSSYASAFDATYSYAFYEAGLEGINNLNGASATQGLPHGGRFTSILDGLTTFQLRPYDGNNVLYLNQNSPAGSLILETPLAYDSISILASSAVGGGTGSLIVQFTDESTSLPINFSAPDWYYHAGAAITHFGRIFLGFNEASFLMEDPADNNPNLYQTTIDLAALGLNTKSIASVAFTKPTGAGNSTHTVTGIFALSGTPSAAISDDITPPSLVRATAADFDYIIQLTFSEPVTGATAGDAFNYQVSGGLSVLQTIIIDSESVWIVVDAPILLGESYTLTATGIHDLAGNVMELNTVTLNAAQEGPCQAPVFHDTITRTECVAGRLDECTYTRYRCLDGSIRIVGEPIRCVPIEPLVRCP